MEVQVEVGEWKYKIVEDMPKIVGSYSVKCGKAVMADQAFNDGYGSTTLLFPITLMAEIEELSKKIEAAIIKNFTGKEED